MDLEIIFSLIYLYNIYAITVLFGNVILNFYWFETWKTRSTLKLFAISTFQILPKDALVTNVENVNKRV